MRKLLKLIARLSILVIIIFVMTNIYIQYDIYTYERGIYEYLSARIQEERDRQEQILHELDHHLSDSYVELVARNQLGLVRSTEIIFVDINQ